MLPGWAGTAMPETMLLNIRKHLWDSYYGRE